MKHLMLVIFVCLGCAGGAQAQNTIDQLMADLASNPGGRAKFFEKRYLTIMEKPIQLSGEMVYLPPHRLEKHTHLPTAETLILDKDRISVVRGSRAFSISLSSRPEAQAFVDSIRSTLSGDRASLERNYGLSLQGERAQWSLVLVPTQVALGRVIQRINVSGREGQVQRIEYWQADGDRTEILIEPMSKP
jgi:outer membrane lipoprotein-sorting protein